jgi:tetratricopeptide (TPR) repeat protein
MKLLFAVLLLIGPLAVFADQPIDNEQAKLIQLALQAEDQGRLEEAIEINKKIVLSNPDEIRSINTIAGLFGRLGQSDEEIEWAQRALKIDGQFEPALINLGNGYAGKGDAMRRYSHIRSSSRSIRRPPKPITTSESCTKVRATTKERSRTTRMPFLQMHPL